MKGHLHLFGFWLAVFIILSVSASAQKNDTVYLKNGDRITGEIKKYEYGILTLKTDAMYTLSIEYDKIGTLHSSKYFEIVTKSGFSYYGSIVKSADSSSIGISVTNDTVTEPISKIVEIIPIKNKFWKKFYGSIDLGLSYYKSSSILQYYINTEINHRSKKQLLSFKLSSLFSIQKISDSTDRTSNNDISLGGTVFFPGKWLMGYKGQYQQNTEMNLDYRFQIGLGAGYDIVHTNPIRFYAIAGLLANREKPMDSISSSTNFEGIASMSFIWLQYRHPKINISTNINFIPSFTVSGRYRLE